MGMNVGGGGGAVRSDINITPLVDVVLVLLIIFMVVTPLMQMGYETNVPQKLEEPPDPSVPPPTDQIMIRIDSAGKYWINKEQIDPQNYAFRLSEATRGKTSKMIFFAASGELPYHQVSDFLDLSYNNGAPNLGMVLDEIDDSGSSAAEQ